MKRPTPEEIRASIAKLKGENAHGFIPPQVPTVGKPTAKKSSKRIRKQGV